MWQAIRDELKDWDFEIVAVALDAGGKAAVEASARPTDLAERPEVVRKMTGWGESEWVYITGPPPQASKEKHVRSGEL